MFRAQTFAECIHQRKHIDTIRELIDMAVAAGITDRVDVIGLAVWHVIDALALKNWTETLISYMGALPPTDEQRRAVLLQLIHKLKTALNQPPQSVPDVKFARYLHAATTLCNRFGHLCVR